MTQLVNGMLFTLEEEAYEAGKDHDKNFLIKSFKDTKVKVTR